MSEINLKELSDSVPFDDAGITEDDYIALDSLKDKEIKIHKVKFFENDNGPGVFALITFAGKKKYICTHSTGIVATLDRVKAQFDADIAVVCTVRYRKSQKSDRMVYALE